MSKFKESLKENIIAFAWALVLTFVVIALINHSWTNFTTDVLWNQNTVSKTDLSVYQSWTKLVLKSNKNIENVASLTIELACNNEKVHIKNDQFKSDSDIAVQEINEWNYYIMLTNLWEIKANQELLEIKNITKEQFVNINFGHIQAIDNNWNILNLTLSK